LIVFVVIISNFLTICSQITQADNYWWRAHSTIFASNHLLVLCFICIAFAHGIVCLSI